MENAKTIIRVSYSNKAGNALLNVSMEGECEHIFAQDCMNDWTDKLMKHVDGKLASVKVEEVVKKQFPTDRPDNLDEGFGLCNKCGDAMVKNPRTNKIFCKSKCWLKG